MLAIFDLDETLIAGDCVSLWGTWLCEQGYVKDIAAFEMQNTFLIEAYQAQTLKQQDCVDWLLEPIHHLSIVEISHLTEAFVKTKIIPIVYPKGLQTIHAFQDKGIETIIISASPNILVHPIAKFCFNISNAFGVEVAEHEGFYIGNILGDIPYQAGKIKVCENYLSHKLKQELQQKNAQKNVPTCNETISQSAKNIIQNSYFYSDSINDLPLLENVKYPNTVNPDAKLRAIAEENNWPIHHFSI